MGDFIETPHNHLRFSCESENELDSEDCKDESCTCLTMSEELGDMDDIDALAIVLADLFGGE